MNKYLKIICISLNFSLSFFLVSCSSDKDPTFKTGGVVVKYNAEDNLNEYNNNPHSLMLAVYQLDNINAFHQLSKDQAGIQKLLSLNKFDPSVLGVDKVFVNIGESGVVNLDRLENAKWIGIVAGYYDITPSQVVKEFRLPSSSSKVLKINLLLGPDAIEKASVK